MVLGAASKGAQALLLLISNSAAALGWLLCLTLCWPGRCIVVPSSYEQVTIAMSGSKLLGLADACRMRAGALGRAAPAADHSAHPAAGAAAFPRQPAERPHRRQHRAGHLAAECRHDRSCGTRALAGVQLLGDFCGSPRQRAGAVLPVIGAAAQRLCLQSAQPVPGSDNFCAFQRSVPGPAGQPQCASLHTCTSTVHALSRGTRILHYKH